MEQQRGFTLLEMMLVALLAGIAASLVMMAFPSDRQSAVPGRWPIFARSSILPWKRVN
ncbi:MULTISPECIES: type II secretion system protein [Symbiopectobacterium]|uniref:type II secretion system protein n=1 Tax=Symbiopectobacterium TaxID=801 RepID=UPI00207A1161|nr:MULTISPECIES: type II secretion system protein [Symbiopectobacterium]